MLPKIMKYEVVSEHDISMLSTKVNNLIADNWQPFECLQVSTPVLNDGVVAPLYTQVMVKYGDKPKCV
jgi:hypothetical protein